MAAGRTWRTTCVKQAMCATLMFSEMEPGLLSLCAKKIWPMPFESWTTPNSAHMRYVYWFDCHGYCCLCCVEVSTSRKDTRMKHTWPSLPSVVFPPLEGMLSFQCQVLLCPPGRDRLHSCEIRWSPQPKLWKITLQKPWQPEQEPQSQRQPQSQQFSGPRQRISPLLASSQPLSLPFLNLSTTDVLPFWCTPSCFYLLWVSPNVTDWFLIFAFHVPMSLWIILVCRCTPTPPLPCPLSFFVPLLPSFSLCFCNNRSCAVLNFKNVELF